METKLPFAILPQPTVTTCGPTCLHAVYRYYGDTVSLGQVIAEVPTLAQGGTLAVFLANHALRKGYRVSIITYDLSLFDPSWFSSDDIDISAKLREQALVKRGMRLQIATRAFIEFLGSGGELAFRDLNPSLIRRYLKRGVPILTGLSATYLHRLPRERGADNAEDDIAGTSSGHFVVLYGYDKKERLVQIADPFFSNPLARSGYYSVRIDRLICSIMLGILTNDANLLIISQNAQDDNA
ncbi:MAG: C39 family peptidase [Chitinispirillaceae bacterium]|nr:C39 family peptidase [Chitinispirillaceae bacterium]